MLLALTAAWLAVIPPLSLPSQTRTLANGLVVIVSPDHSVPGVAIDLRYHVGSKDEDPGRTGFAHLFEHLMFMGARHVPYPQFDTLMEAAGGTNNASTGRDVTEYHEVGPSNLLETFLWMEADRLATLGQEMTQEKLETQRKIVLNERRQSYENRPLAQRRRAGIGQALARRAPPTKLTEQLLSDLSLAAHAHSTGTRSQNDHE